MKLIVWSENSPMGGKRAHEERGDDTLTLEGTAIELIHIVSQWKDSKFKQRVSHVLREEIENTYEFEELYVTHNSIVGDYSQVTGTILLDEVCNLHATWSFQGLEEEPTFDYMSDEVVYHFLYEPLISPPEVREVYMESIKDYLLERIGPSDDLDYLLQLLEV